MPESSDKSNAAGTLFDTWMTSVNDFWSDVSAPFSMPDNKKGQGSDTEDETQSEGDFLNLWKTGLKSWQNVVSAMGKTGTSGAPFYDTGTFGETFSKMTQPVFSTLTNMLHQWQSQSEKSASTINAFSFDTLDTDVLNIWKTLYDNEFRKFLKIPQLGLAREHQEKAARFMDRFSLLQSELAEFLAILAIPFKKTQASFQKRLTELAESGQSPSEINDYYRIWLKILEGHYMTLFQSPDYIRSLAKTLSASAAYTRAKKDLINDVLGQLSMPSSENLDAVYKDLYALKKRLRAIEQLIKTDR